MQRKEEESRQLSVNTNVTEDRSRLIRPSASSSSRCLTFSPQDEVPDAQPGLVVDGWVKER